MKNTKKIIRSISKLPVSFLFQFNPIVEFVLADIWKEKSERIGWDGYDLRAS